MVPRAPSGGFDQLKSVAPGGGSQNDRGAVGGEQLAEQRVGDSGGTGLREGEVNDPRVRLRVLPGHGPEEPVQTGRPQLGAVRGAFRSHSYGEQPARAESEGRLEDGERVGQHRWPGGGQRVEVQHSVDWSVRLRQQVLGPQDHRVGAVPGEPRHHLAGNLPRVVVAEDHEPLPSQDGGGVAGPGHVPVLLLQQDGPQLEALRCLADDLRGASASRPLPFAGPAAEPTLPRLRPALRAAPRAMR